MTQSLPNNPPAPGADLGYQGASFVDRDMEHLKVLSICWYVLSGLAAFFGFFPLIYVAIGIAFVVQPAAMGGPGAPPPPAFVGWAFIIMGSAVSLLAWSGSVLGFLAARALPRRRRLVLCYVAAGLACLQIPIGTCLGVFTFVVLGRPSVRASFV